MDAPTPLPPDAPAAKAEIDSMLAERDGPLWNTESPGHTLAAKRYAELHKIADGAAPPTRSPRESLSARAEEILASPGFLRGTHPRQKALQAEYVEVHRELDGAPAREITPDAAPAALIPLPEIPGVADPKWNIEGVNEYATNAGDLGASKEEAADFFKHAVTVLRQPDTGPDPAGQAALRNAWGPQASRHLRAADLAAKRLGDEVYDLVTNTHLGDDARVLRRLAQLGAPLLEAEEAIARIHADRTGPYYDDRHPDHAKMVHTVTKLYKRLYGDR